MIREGVFVAGTDTGVGKTHLTAALVAALRQRDIPALPFKPVQTGARRPPGPDVRFVLAACGLRPDHATCRQLAPVCLRLAASPHLAAHAEGYRIRLAPLVRGIQTARAAKVVPVVEGAGGLMVPLNHRDTMLDLMQALGLPVLLVARPGLGTLNHTLLSAHALDSAQLTLAAVVLFRLGRWGRIERDNQATLAARLNCPILVLPDLAHASRTTLARAGHLILKHTDAA